MNQKVQAYLSNATQWKKEMTQLRVIMLATGLLEDLKWGKPCYSFEGTNIVVIQGFKAYCAVLFFNGYMLQDTENILVKTGENTRVGRQARFTSVKEIIAQEAILKAYINEAISIEKSGIKPPPKVNKPQDIPDELLKKFKSAPVLKAAFYALTPGRQRAYLIYFASAKQSKTRETRIEKSVKDILAGKGIND